MAPLVSAELHRYSPLRSMHLLTSLPGEGYFILDSSVGKVYIYREVVCGGVQLTLAQVPERHILWPHLQSRQGVIMVSFGVDFGFSRHQEGSPEAEFVSYLRRKLIPT